jgi:hypothetical protein
LDEWAIEFTERTLYFQKSRVNSPLSLWERVGVRGIKNESQILTLYISLLIRSELYVYQGKSMGMDVIGHLLRDLGHLYPKNV